MCTLVLGIIPNNQPLPGFNIFLYYSTKVR